MSTEVPLVVQEKWNSTTAQIGAYTGESLQKIWQQRVCEVLEAMFSPLRLSDIPDEFVDIHLNLDDMVLEHLWMRTFRTDMPEISLAHLRFMLDAFFDDYVNLKLSPSEYSYWVAELLILLNANEETGSISKDDFIRLFPLWLASRDLGLSIRSGVVPNIIDAWSLVDVSHSGVVSIESLSRWLLPFAFRSIFPYNKEIEETKLMEAWVNLMSVKDFQRRSDWINHWGEFVNLDPLAFAAHLDTPERTQILAEEAVKAFECSKKDVKLFESLMSCISTNSKQTRSRVFSLWLVSLRHGKCRIVRISISESLCDPLPIIPSSTFRAIGTNLWSQYLGAISEARKNLFENWLEKLISVVSISIANDFVVDRAVLISKFLTDHEVIVLWQTFAISDSDQNRIKPGELRKMFQRIYRSAEIQTGHWIVEKWISDFVQFCSELGLFASLESPQITRDIFISAFPIFYSIILADSKCLIENEAASAVWPLSDDKRVVYSEVVLSDLLTDVWNRTIPSELCMPCQSWWLDRCIDRLSRNGRGITRSVFVEMFLSRSEIHEVLAQVGDPITVQTLSRILNKSGLTSPEAIEEFFLLTDIDVSTTNPDILASVSRAAFMVAFPLWHAAHVHYQSPI